MKGELEDDPNNPQQRQTRSRFLEQTGADYVRFVRQDLPINPLYRDQNPAVNAQIANEIASLIRCFAPQLGAGRRSAAFTPLQRSNARQSSPSPDSLEP